MRLWTHHPSSFQLDDPKVQVDPTKGKYWRKQRSAFRYQQVLPLLQKTMETSQLLWCCTTRGRYLPTSEPSDLVEWEIDLPLREVTLISVPVWEDLVWSRGDNWGSLFLTGLSESQATGKDINAIVRLPLPDDCLTCHGQLPPRYLKESKPNPAYREYIERIGYAYFEFHQG